MAVGKEQSIGPGVTRVPPDSFISRSVCRKNGCSNKLVYSGSVHWLGSILRTRLRGIAGQVLGKWSIAMNIKARIATISSAAVLSIALAAAPAMAEHEDASYGRSDAIYDYARVIRSEPIIRYVTVRTPVQECWNDTEYYSVAQRPKGSTRCRSNKLVYSGSVHWLGSILRTRLRGIAGQVLGKWSIAMNIKARIATISSAAVLSIALAAAPAMAEHEDASYGRSDAIYDYARD